jgi:hypothetical protein
VTLLFQLWLLALACTAIFRDSLPHLAAQLAGHALNTAWAAFRVRRTVELRKVYEAYVVRAACGGVDPLWCDWSDRLCHAIIVLAFSVIMLGATAFLSVVLLRVCDPRLR